MWNFYDKWYIITLKNRDMKDIKNNLKNIGVDNYEVLYYEPYNNTSINNSKKDSSLLSLFLHKDTENIAAKNLFYNTYNTIKKGIENNYQNIVILEDDARFKLPFDLKKMKYVSNWLKNNKWDIFYYGHCPWPFPFISFFKNKYIVSPYNSLLSHSIAFSQTGMKNILYNMEKLINNDKYMHVDRFYNKYVDKKYAIFPSICHQNIAPAIYSQIADKINLKSFYKYDHNEMFYGLEITAILLPIFLIIISVIIISFVIYKRYYK